MKNTVLAVVLVERRMFMIILVSKGLSAALSLVQLWKSEPYRAPGI